MMECGTTCLAMIFKYYGFYNIQSLLRELGEVSTEGTDLYKLSEVAESFGFKTEAYELEYDYLIKIPLPCIAHYEGIHFVVIYKATKDYVWVSDPAYGKDKYSRTNFMTKWNGVVLTLEPTSEMFKNKDVLELVQQHRKKEKSLFRKFYLPVLSSLKGVIFEIFLATFLLQLLALAVPFFTQAIVDNVLVNQNKKLLFAILLGMIGVFFTQVLLLYARNIILVQFKNRFELDFFSKFFSHFISLKQNYYDAHKREDFISRFQENIKIREMANPVLIQNFIEIIFLIIYIPILFLYNTALGFIAFLFVIFYFLISLYFVPKMISLYKKGFFKNMEALGSFLDTLLSIKTVKLLSIEKLKFWVWQNKYKHALNVNLEAEQKQIILASIQKSLFFLGQITIFWLGAYMAFNGQLSIGQYLAFVTIFMIIMNTLNNVGYLWNTITQLSVSFRRLNDVLLQEPEASDIFEQKEITSVKDIELKNLSFKYFEKEENYVLRNINLKIGSGEHIGIVGRNGAGKTTLVKLLLSLYPSYEGNILLDNVELKRILPKSVRKKIFLFPQDIHIFTATIKENILYANPNASLEELIHAAKLADLHDFVKSLYLGYNHKVGDFGGNLSGGQVLKIGFARLFISNPDIIILDEASSNLDLETENKIMTNIKNHFRGKTVITIAHRIYTLKDADRILVIDEGKITEDGSHEELISKDGLYSKFMKTYVDY